MQRHGGIKNMVCLETCKLLVEAGNEDMRGKMKGDEMRKFKG